MNNYYNSMLLLNHYLTDNIILYVLFVLYTMRGGSNGGNGEIPPKKVTTVVNSNAIEVTKKYVF